MIVSFFVLVAATSASLHGGVAIIAPYAYGGAVGGHGAHGAGAVISGPAGTVATSGNGAWGGVGGWGGGWVGGYGGWGGAGGWAGSGHEGQWVPDNNEAHYDDGSYRPEHHNGGHWGHW